MPTELTVALRKESVDRNEDYKTSVAAEKTSLSARRAWIEMPSKIILCLITWSLSARRAWIEMLGFSRLGRNLRVALRKESVDRNMSLIKS